MRPILMVLAAVALLAGAAHADTTINYELRDFEDADGAQVTTGAYQISGKNVAANFGAPGPATGGGRLVFLGDQEILWIINDGDKSYMQLDRKTLAAFAEQMKTAKANLDAQLSKLSPEQRAMVEKSMKGMLGGEAELPAMEFRATEEKKTIGSFKCQRHDILEEGVKSGEVWAAPYSAVELKPTDMQAITGMIDFFMEYLTAMSSMMPGLQDARREVAAFNKAVDGFPVLTRNMDGDKVESEMELKSVSHDQLPAAVFALPAGYKQQTMPTAPGSK